MNPKVLPTPTICRPRVHTPPPPPPPERSSGGRARLTVSDRLPSSVPFSMLIAFWASASFSISTKPNPFDRPVSRSVIRVTDFTVPALLNSVVSSVSVAVYGKFPTYSLVSMFSGFLCVHKASAAGRSLGSREAPCGSARGAAPYYHGAFQRANRGRLPPLLPRARSPCVGGGGHA